MRRVTSDLLLVGSLPADSTETAFRSGLPHPSVRGYALAKEILEGKFHPGDRIAVDAQGGHLAFTTS